MYVKKTGGYAYTEILSTPQFKGLLDVYFPETFQSSRWKHWKAVLDLKLCRECRRRHGKIYAANEILDTKPPLHERCRCDILPMKAIRPGGATKDGENGADYWLVHYGKLPDYYCSKEKLIELGWKGKSRSQR